VRNWIYTVFIMGTFTCTGVNKINSIPDEPSGRVICEYGLVYRVLDAANGTVSVDAVEANPVWGAAPRRSTAWAAAKLEREETDRSLARLCFRIAAAIAKARAHQESWLN
jgi:hypothetical protein